jgi:hypothetical protein
VMDSGHPCTVELGDTVSRPNVPNTIRKPAHMAVAPYDQFEGPERA